MADWKGKFETLVSKNHKEQAVWWLNGFWADGGEAEAETIWELTHLCIEIDTGMKLLYGKRKVEAAYGCDLDEMKSHVFLEKLGETLTVRALRKRLKELDIDNNKRMALSEYMLAKYGKTPEQLVNSPQGGGASQEEMDAAQAALDAAMNAVAAAVERLAEQTEAEERAKQAALDAAEALEKQKTAEAALKKAENELRAAVEALEAEQKAFDDKKAGFEAKIANESLSSMKRNMAKNELAQMMSEDPLPLRKAKITQGAALKRAEKARKPFAEATKKAEEDKIAAEKAVEEAAAAKKATEAAVEEAKEQVKKCQASLNELKSRAGTPHGAVWWMEREMKETQKFMPK